MSPVIICHIITAAFTVVESVPRYAVAAALLVVCAFVVYFFFMVLTAFSSSWAMEFERMETERNVTDTVNQDLRKQAEIELTDYQKYTHNFREYIKKATVDMTEKEGLADLAEVVMDKVSQLDGKVVGELEKRESRHLMSRLSVRGKYALASRNISAQYLVDMVRRTSSNCTCTCNLGEEQQMAITVKIDARALW